MIVKVRNVSNVQLAVSIVNVKTRAKTEVMIQPKSGVQLPKDYIVDQNFAIRYKQALRIIKKDR